MCELDQAQPLNFIFFTMLLDMNLYFTRLVGNMMQKLFRGICTSNFEDCKKNSNGIFICSIYSVILLDTSQCKKWLSIEIVKIWLIRIQK